MEVAADLACLANQQADLERMHGPTTLSSLHLWPDTTTHAIYIMATNHWAKPIPKTSTTAVQSKRKHEISSCLSPSLIIEEIRPVHPDDFRDQI